MGTWVERVREMFLTFLFMPVFVVWWEHITHCKVKHKPTQTGTGTDVKDVRYWTMSDINAHFLKYISVQWSIGNVGVLLQKLKFLFTLCKKVEHNFTLVWPFSDHWKVTQGQSRAFVSAVLHMYYDWWEHPVGDRMKAFFNLFRLCVCARARVCDFSECLRKAICHLGLCITERNHPSWRYSLSATG